MSRHKTRQDLALEYGATEIVSERGEAGVARIKELTGNVGADAVLECVGTQESMTQALQAARPGAMIGYVGVPHGADAVQIMSENPYRLARDIRGIGFKTADAIAMKLGIEKTAMIRLRAGISYGLSEAMDEGHCGLPTDKLIPLAEELLEAPKELIVAALELERAEGNVVADAMGDTRCTFLAGLYKAEQAIADRLMQVLHGRLPLAWIDPEKAIPWVEARTGMKLAES